VITQSGTNLGIGTVSPQTALSIEPTIDGSSAGYSADKLAFFDNGTAIAGLMKYNGSMGGLFGRGNAGVGIYVNPTYSHNGTNDRAALFVTTGGNVGIGTTSPGSALELGLGNELRVDGLNGSTGPALSVGGSGSFSIDAPGIVSGRFIVTSSGQVGIGTATPGATLDVNGTVHTSGNVILGSGAYITFADGSTQASAYTAPCPSGGDYAESVDVSGGRGQYEPGDVLVIDPDHAGNFLKVTDRYSTLVAGVYSTKPGLVGRRQPATKSKDGEIPMAMVGIVPTKVSTENGAIHIGDLLVSSSTAGHAMKGTDRSLMMGAVIGKALGTLDAGTGVIEVLISLQ
jgi:hypothetical protein